MASTITPQQQAEIIKDDTTGSRPIDIDNVFQAIHASHEYDHLEKMFQDLTSSEEELNTTSIRTDTDAIYEIAKFVKMFVDRSHPGETSLSDWQSVLSADEDEARNILYGVQQSLETGDYFTVDKILDEHFERKFQKREVDSGDYQKITGRLDQTKSAAIRHAFNNSTFRQDVSFVEKLCGYLKNIDAESEDCQQKRVLKIVGAPGSGKSRGVDEFAKNFHVIPLDLGSDLAAEQTYPPPDVKVRNRLEGMDRKWSVYYLSALLNALMQQATSWSRSPFDDIYQVFTNADSLQCPPTKAQVSDDFPLHQSLGESALDLCYESNGSPAQHFRLFMTVGRDAAQGVWRRVFYNNVLKAAEQLFWEWRWMHYVDSGFRVEGSCHSEPVDLRADHQRTLTLSALGLSTSITCGGRDLSPQKPRSVFIIDHAQKSHLHQPQKMIATFNKSQAGAEPSWILAHSLEKAFEYLTQRFKAVWMAYVVSMHDCDPKEDYPTFHTRKFSLEAPLPSEISTLDKASLVCSRLRFGHVQWTQYYKSLKTMTDEPAELSPPVPHGFMDLVESVECKLTHIGTVDMHGKQIASFSQRIALRYDPGRTLVSLLENRQAMTTNLTTPLFTPNASNFQQPEQAMPESTPDPLLADIVAHSWNRDGLSPHVCLNQVLDLEPTIDPGQNGELVLACLVVNALDTERFSQVEVSDPNYPIPSPVMKVTSFLERLFSRDSYEEHVAKVALGSNLHAGVNPKTLEETFSAARMMVTHFSRGDGQPSSPELLRKPGLSIESQPPRERQLSAETLLRCIPRGEAILFLRNDAEPDLVIPFLLGGNILEVNNVSAILVKGVTKLDDIAAGWDVLNKTSRNLFPQPGHPVIHVLYDLSNSQAALILAPQITDDQDPISAYRIQSNGLTYSGASADAISGTQAYWELLQKCIELNAGRGGEGVDVEHLRSPTEVIRRLAPSPVGGSPGESDDGDDKEI